VPSVFQICASQALRGASPLEEGHGLGVAGQQQPSDLCPPGGYLKVGVACLILFYSFSSFFLSSSQVPKGTLRVRIVGPTGCEAQKKGEESGGTRPAGRHTSLFFFKIQLKT